MFSYYLMFNRNCEEALNVYSKAFDAKILEIQKYGEMPPNPNFPVAEADKNLVLHARIQIGGMEFMGADSTQRNTVGDNMYINVATPDESMVQKAWDTLKEDGEIYMDLAPSFFAKWHGSLRDKFGVSWMFTVFQ